jgi:hypothetical protein
VRSGTPGPPEPGVTRLFAVALILGFSVYFTWDIVRLRKALLHPDFYTTYYAFRHWFATRLADGQFPLWNPHWGIGQAADVWATIPLDLYTPLELAFGPRYHLFHALQALLVLTAALYGFVRLGFSPLLSAAGAILFFLTPHITFFYFYFIVAHSYVAHVLLFTFVVLWFTTGQRRYLFFITWTTIFSMLGTKLEFWFFQTVYFVFLAFAGSAIFRGGRLYEMARSASLPCAFMALGVAAHAWQLNILSRLMTESQRAGDSGLAALASWELYRNLALSLTESVFLKLALLSGLLILALRTRPRRAYALVVLAGALCALFLHQEQVTFESDPALRNGSLESWTQTPEGRVVPEYFSYDGAGDVRRTTAPGEVRSGTSASFIGVPETGEARLRYTLPDVAPYRGKEVRLTFWSRSGNPTPGPVRAIIEDGYRQPSVLTVPGGGAWAHNTLTHYVDAEARGLSITMAVDSSAPAGLFVDDIELARSSGFVRSKASRDGTLLGLFATFVSGPVLAGAFLGLALSLGLSGRSSWREYAAQTLLVFPLVYYYCRQAHGDLGEVHYVRLAPAVLQIVLAAGVWLGCARLRRDPLARLAYASVCFVFLMRDQGQIILTYLMGWLWIPTRDNYIVDFAFLLLALLGLQRLADRTAAPADGHRRRGPGLAEGLALTAVAALILVTHSNLYYVHPLIGRVPDGYPYFSGVPSVRDLFRRLKEGSTSRAYLHNEPFMEFHHGAGSSLVEGFSQVTSYASLNNARYRDWTTYHRVGIRPEQHWRGYPNEYTPGTIARIAQTNTLGYTNSQIYSDTLINRPPLDGNLLRLLGVGRVLHVRFTADPYTIDDRVPPLPNDVSARLQPSRVRAISTPGAPTGPDPMFVADLSTPLPRAFVIPTIPPEYRPEFESELTPRWETGFLRTPSLRLSVAPADITRYEPEHVRVTVSSRENGILVLTDLYHPFWRVSVDGQPAELTPALLLFRGVDVPAGTHRVDFFCRIPAARPMLALSLLSALASVAAFARRSTPREPTSTAERRTG